MKAKAMRGEAPKNLRIFKIPQDIHLEGREPGAPMTEYTFAHHVGKYLDRNVGRKHGEVALYVFFAPGFNAEIAMVGTPGAFRELLCDLLAALMDIEA